MSDILKGAPAALLALLLPAVATGAKTALTSVPGDPSRGRAVVLDRDRGHCLLCHRIAQLDEGFQGTIGPVLSDVGERLRASELRERIVDPTRLNPDTAMPAYYRVEGLRQVAEGFRDRPVLTAQEVEDVVAFLTTLRTTPES
ncbi:MAG: sulfur oxidation c-type cytochrome SoxX [Pseudomonadota bacterium]